MAHSLARRVDVNAHVDIVCVPECRYVFACNVIGVVRQDGNDDPMDAMENDMDGEDGLRRSG